jgi:hypothetical protein
MRSAFGGLRVQPIVDIVAVDEGEMFHVQKSDIKRTNVKHGATKVRLGVSLPGNTCIRKELYQMLIRRYWGLARMVPRRIEVLLCMRRST